MDNSALKLLKTSSNPAEKLEEIPKKDLGNRGFKNPAKSSTENPTLSFLPNFKFKICQTCLDLEFRFI
jgi:hypothetical protein